MQHVLLTAVSVSAASSLALAAATGLGVPTQDSTIRGATAPPAAEVPVVDLVPDPAALEFPHVPDEIFVRFRDDLGEDARDAIIDSVAGEVRHAYRTVPGLVNLRVGVSVADALDALRGRADAIRYVEPVYWMETTDRVPNDARWSDLYGMRMINAPAVWTDTTGSPTFRIAVIDSGIDPSHPDLASNIIENPADPIDGVDNDGNGLVDDFNGWDFFSNDNDPSDQNSHGTHTSGTVGAIGDNSLGVVGVNWRCEIIPLRVGNQSLSSSAILASLEYACELGAKVSNNSYGGGGFSQAFFDLIEAVGTQCDHVFVASAGNGGFASASYPALYDLPNIISVAAVDSSEQLAGFSQFGIPSVDIAAPGVSVLSTEPGGTYGFKSGTSMAAPHVAGVAALVHEALGSASATDVVEIVLQSARQVPQLDGIVVTGGIVDAEAALSNLFLAPVAELITTIPDRVDPGTELQVALVVDERNDVVTSVEALYRSADGAFEAIPATLSGSVWRATLPTFACGDSPEVYFAFTGATAGTQFLPAEGADAAFSLVVGDFETVSSDDFNGGSPEWSVSGDVTSPDAGLWQRGVPAGGDRGDPSIDADGSGQCWLTGNVAGNSDVDGGRTILTSTAFDATPAGTFVGYARWFDNAQGASPFTDVFRVEISGDDGATWSPLETVGPDSPEVTGGWFQRSFRVADFVTPGTLTRVRFIAEDADPGSVVEAAVDAFRIERFVCDDPSNPADVDGDGAVNGADLSLVLGAWSTADAAADVNGDGIVDGADLAEVLAAWDG